MNVDLSWYRTKHAKALDKPINDMPSRPSGGVSFAIHIESVEDILFELRRNPRVIYDVVFDSPVLLKYRAIGDVSRPWTYISRRATKKGKDGKVYVKGPDASIVSKYQIV